MLFNKKNDMIAGLEAEIKSLRQKLRDAGAVIAEQDCEIKKLRSNYCGDEVAVQQEGEGDSKLLMATASKNPAQNLEYTSEIEKQRQNLQDSSGDISSQKVPVISLNAAELQSIDYMIQNLNELLLHSEVTVTDNPYVFYWFRCHPLQPKDEYLYAHLPQVSLYGDADWSGVVLVGPDFSDEHKRQRAYHLLQQAVSESIFEDTQRENVHSSDKERHHHSKILSKIFKKYNFDVIFDSTDLNIQARIEGVIALQYEKEIAQLKLRLNQKRPFVEPKYKKLMVPKFDDFGEPVQNHFIVEDIGDLLEGINIKKDFDGEFKLFSQPEEDFYFIAKREMDLWIADEDMQLVPENGHDFEHWVAAKLNDAGWTASVTQASGDDGVDVIAMRKGFSVAVQCKRFKGSVGNKAVQEVYSGMKHMQLDRAVVISTGKYTKAAQNLASTTGVLLLSEHDIPHLWELL